MTQDDVLEQKKKIVQQQLECWSTVRKVLHQQITSTSPGGASTLALTQALEIATKAEGEALRHFDEAYNEDPGFS